ncbi:MAG: host attachment protein [Rhodoferax sp.]
MKKTWILVANAARARVLERRAGDNALLELADFVCPPKNLIIEAEGGDLTGAAGKGHGRTGHAGTQFEPRMEVKDKARALFARQLADYLNQGMTEQQCDALVVIASSPMLGDLKPFLSKAAASALERAVASDLTRYQHAELKERVERALQLPA